MNVIIPTTAATGDHTSSNTPPSPQQQPPPPLLETPESCTLEIGQVTATLQMDHQVTPTAARFDTCWRMLNHVHVVTLLTVYAGLIGLVQLKYQSKKESPFQTHTFFMIMSVVAIIVFAPTYWFLYHNTNQQNVVNPTNQQSSNHSPSVIQMMLVSLAFFSIVLAPLSLVFVLLLPPKFMWIGYSATSLLLLSIIAYASFDKVISLGKNMRNYIGNKF